MPRYPLETAKDLDRRFNHHAPDDERVRNHELVRQECKRLAKTVVDLVPPGRERSLALTHLEEVMMWSNAGIAREGK